MNINLNLNVNIVFLQMPSTPNQCDQYNQKMESTVQQQDLAFKQIRSQDRWMITVVILALIAAIVFTLDFSYNPILYRVIIGGVYSFTLFIYNVYKQNRQALLDIATKPF